MKFLLPIAAIICTTISTLMAITFCLAGGANSTPEQIRALKIWLVVISLLGVGGITAGIFLMRASQHGWAAGAAFLPTVLFLVGFIVAMILGK